VIVVRVELHSGVTGEVTELGRCEIVNDETGTIERGHYDVVVTSGDTPRTRRGRVEGYARKTRPVWALVRLALLAALGAME
jgi:hypothetical protein